MKTQDLRKSLKDTHTNNSAKKTCGAEEGNFTSFSSLSTDERQESPVDGDQSGGCVRTVRVSAQPEVMLRADSSIIPYQALLHRAAASLSHTHTQHMHVHARTHTRGTLHPSSRGALAQRNS